MAGAVRDLDRVVRVVVAMGVAMVMSVVGFIHRLLSDQAFSSQCS